MTKTVTWTLGLSAAVLLYLYGALLGLVYVPIHNVLERRFGG